MENAIVSYSRTDMTAQNARSGICSEGFEKVRIDPGIWWVRGERKKLKMRMTNSSLQLSVLQLCKNEVQTLRLVLQFSRRMGDGKGVVEGIR